MKDSKMKNKLHNMPSVCPICGSVMDDFIETHPAVEDRNGIKINCIYTSFSCPECGATFTDWFEVDAATHKNTFQGKFFIEDGDGNKYKDLYINKELEKKERK